MDLEDVIDVFCIRKLNPYDPDDGIRTHSNTLNEKVHKCIPLMIKHIKTLNDVCTDETSKITKAFNGRIQFKNCLVYGKIMGKYNETKTKYTYLLDDGTGSLSINIFKKTKEETTLLHMEEELESVKKYMFAQNKYEIVHSLRNLLLKTKHQLGNCNISLGSKVLVYGRPSYYRNQTFLDIHYVTQDVDSNIEISYKDYLVEWYSKNILKD